jgi:hypothetical protein
MKRLLENQKQIPFGDDNLKEHGVHHYAAAVLDAVVVLDSLVDE